jgi:hypothetical protein
MLKRFVEPQADDEWYRMAHLDHAVDEARTSLLDEVRARVRQHGLLVVLRACPFLWARPAAIAHALWAWATGGHP